MGSKVKSQPKPALAPTGNIVRAGLLGTVQKITIPEYCDPMRSRHR